MAAAGGGGGPSVRTRHPLDPRGRDYAELNRRAHVGRAPSSLLPSSAAGVRSFYRAIALSCVGDLDELDEKGALLWATKKADAVWRRQAKTFGDARDVPLMVEASAGPQGASTGARRTNITATDRLRAVSARIEGPSEFLWQAVLVATLSSTVWDSNVHLAEKLTTANKALVKEEEDCISSLSVLGARLGVAVSSSARALVKFALGVVTGQEDAFWSIFMHSCGGVASPGFELPPDANLRRVWDEIVGKAYPAARNRGLYGPATAQEFVNIMGDPIVTSAFEGVYAVLLFRFMHAYVAELDDAVDEEPDLVVTDEMFEMVLRDIEKQTVFEHNRMAFIAGAAVRALDKEIEKTGYKALVVGLTPQESEPKSEIGGGRGGGGGGGGGGR